VKVIIIIRNPRYAIPSYHTLLSELHYARDPVTAYKYISKVFTLRPPIEQWEKWRALRFNDEIKLWGWFIDYWMEGGTQYWMDENIERNGQHPFKFLNGTEKKQDSFCASYDLDCRAKTAICYERLVNPRTGASEANKVAKVLEGKQNLNVIDEEARQCVWRQAMNLPANDDRAGPSHTDYGFTIEEMAIMIKKLKSMVLKYSGKSWVGNDVADHIVGCFREYITDIESELTVKELNMENRDNVDKAPEETDDFETLIKWYQNLGEGDPETMMNLWYKEREFLLKAKTSKESMTFDTQVKG